MQPSIKTPILSVTQLNQQVHQLLTMEVGTIGLKGEVSNFSQPASGHWYFTLKDDRCQVRCAMFSRSNQKVALRPQNGQHVLVQASVTLYQPRGDYQLMVEQLQALGDGLLQQRFEQCKRLLASEGLFDMQHKQPLPADPDQIGIITSATGAALHDILHILKRRNPALAIVIYPTAVQGSEAPQQIIQAIKRANQRQECQLLILARGGGSLEDLCSFNEVALARAIFASRLPIVSAIGHETDITIADFVADLRAPTPSAAAELVSRDQRTMAQQLNTLQQQVELAADHYLAYSAQKLERISHRLHQQHPQLHLAHRQSHLLTLNHQLHTAWSAHYQRLQQTHWQLQYRLQQAAPSAALQIYQQQLVQQQHRMQQALLIALHQLQQHFTTLCARLQANSPLAALGRGFSITCHTDGKPIHSIAAIAIGQTMRTCLKDGWLESRVEACQSSTT